MALAAESLTIEGAITTWTRFTCAKVDVNVLGTLGALS
jgi:hypothetical protein